MATEFPFTYTTGLNNIEPGDTTRGGVVGFMSYGRLCELLSVHEAKHHETVVGLVFTEQGINVHYTTQHSSTAQT